jgi:two-component system cell cycle sensor histidine kinase/response regulator CckA
MVLTLEQLRQQLEEAQRIAGIGSWSWDLVTGAVAWSRETYRILGVSPDIPPSFELVLSAAIDDTHAQALLEHTQAALRGERPYDFEIPARMADGRIVTLCTRGVVERDEQGTPLRLVGTMQDVTAARAAETALREREALFRTLAESSPLGVFLVDAQWQPTYANRRLLRWFAMDFEAFRRREWRQRVHPDDAPAFAGGDPERADNGRPVDMQYRIVVDGTTRWIRVRTEPLRDEETGLVSGHVGSVLDISAERFAAEEQDRLEAQLQQARRLEALGLLAGGIAHDFNNMLVGILANASLAREQLPPGAVSRAPLDDIATSAHRAADLTRELLAYAGRARVERRPIALHELVQELPVLLGARVPPQVTLEVTAGPRLAVDGDATQLRQVVLNLLTNAVDAIGEVTGTVSLDVVAADLTAAQLAECVLGGERPAGSYAIITVRDTGGGMPPEVQERMFDPFFSTKHNGRGLGLAATLGILNTHGGAIDVRSVPGRGTSIRVVLPVSRYPFTPPSSPAVDALPDDGETGTVLLVDDDASARTAARRILERAGFAVVEAVNGQDALDRYAALPSLPKAIVLDVSMPVMGGAECLRHLRARGSTVPVLMVSGYDADDVASHIVAAGDATFLQKPYTAAALQQAVRALLV